MPQNATQNTTQDTTNTPKRSILVPLPMDLRRWSLSLSWIFCAALG